jgi:hypothetical protein
MLFVAPAFGAISVNLIGTKAPALMARAKICIGAATWLVEAEQIALLVPVCRQMRDVRAT